MFLPLVRPSVPPILLLLCIVCKSSSSLTTLDVATYQNSTLYATSQNLRSFLPSNSSDVTSDSRSYWRTFVAFSTFSIDKNSASADIAFELLTNIYGQFAKQQLDRYFLVFCSDIRSCQAAWKHNYPVILHEAVAAADMRNETMKAVNLKWYIAHSIVLEGFDVLFCDWDVVFLQPLHRVFHAALHSDFVYLNDYMPKPGDTWPQLTFSACAGATKQSPTPCASTGFWYARSGSRQLEAILMDTYNTSVAKQEHEQIVFNGLLPLYMMAPSRQLRIHGLPLTEFMNIPLYGILKAQLPPEDLAHAALLHCGYVHGLEGKVVELKKTGAWVSSWSLGTNLTTRKSVRVALHGEMRPPMPKGRQGGLPWTFGR